MSEKSWVKEWLSVARVTDDPAGDLIADMRLARDLPPIFKNKEAMRGYLRCKGACREAIAAVDDVWPRYRRWMDRHPWGLL